MIDGSAKHNRYLHFELQSLRVIERRSNNKFHLSSSLEKMAANLTCQDSIFFNTIFDVQKKCLTDYSFRSFGPDFFLEKGGELASPGLILVDKYCNTC